MKCPRCVQKIHRAAESCPHCGFKLANADEWFGGNGRRMLCLTDDAGVFLNSERQGIEEAISRISRRFPQLFAAVYTGSAGDLQHLRTLGFWLLNRAIFTDAPSGRDNKAGILLVLDPSTKSAGISYGYWLDPYLEEADTFDCLSRAHAYWLDGHYAEGVIKALAHLEWVLVRSAHRSKRIARRWTSESSAMPNGAQSGVDFREESP